jgi:nicotinate-nucleotide pyrophosphorylase (carboxylating)
MPPPLPEIVIEPIVKLALAEDLGRAGDVTSDAIVPLRENARFVLCAREPGVIAGLEAAQLAAKLVDRDLVLSIAAGDGSVVAAGETFAEIEGRARSILTVERTMLNFVGRLSGVATLTRRYVDAIAGASAQIISTRKTTPGLRALEKRAVLLGGGGAHRYGLDDAILIKDNHIAVAGSIGEAIRRAKAAAGHLVAIEVEVDRLEQLEEALRYAPHAILLDNFAIEDLARAVALVRGHAVLEASGGVRLDNVRAIAETGVNYISVGALTHSAPTLDIGLDAI